MASLLPHFVSSFKPHSATLTFSFVSFPGVACCARLTLADDKGHTMSA